MKKPIILFYAFLMLLSITSCKRSNDLQPVQQPAATLKAEGFEDAFAPLYKPVIVAGKTGQSGYVNGTGSNARFNYPYGICVAPDGSLLVGDNLNDVVRQIKSPGIVSTAIKLEDYDNPSDIAVANDGTIAVAVVTDIDEIFYYKHGNLQYHFYSDCDKCYPAGIVAKDPNGKSFWFIDTPYQGAGGSIPYGTPISYLEAATEFNPSATSGSFLYYDETTALNAYANGYKYLSTEHSLYSFKSGVVNHLLKNTTFDGITGIAANHDGTKIYLADGGDIKLVTQCISGKCPTLLTVLVKGVNASKIALSNSEKVLFFTSGKNNTVSKVQLP